MIDLRKLSFGSPAAITTGMGLIVGLDIATAVKATIVTSLLIIGIGDNLTDSLSVHIYQESEGLPERGAFRTTVANFFARFFVTVTFIIILLPLPLATAMPVCVVWGFVLLSVLTYFLAKARGVNAVPEILKHCAVAFLVIAISTAIGRWIPAMIPS
jgi:VIT1/CCC1 family predicted Fe2+/Mn2+ transporter